MKYLQMHLLRMFFILQIHERYTPKNIFAKIVFPHKPYNIFLNINLLYNFC